MKKFMFFNIILSLIILINAVYYIAIYNDISKNVIRLHIIANSNSQNDTEIKFMVRDKILDNLKSSINTSSTKEDIINSLPQIEKIANEFLKQENIKYGAGVYYENTDIPRKEYNGISLPEGKYNAIRVVLGTGGGENWWCVAYPPLCFSENTCGEISQSGNELLKNSMNGTSYKIITSDIKYELKIVELAKKLLNIIN